MKFETTTGSFTDDFEYETFGPVTYSFQGNATPQITIVSPFNTDCEVALLFAQITSSAGETIVSYDVDLFPAPTVPAPGQLFPNGINGFVMLGNTNNSFSMSFMPLWHPLKQKIIIYALNNAGGISVVTFYFRRRTDIAIPTNDTSHYGDPTE